MKDVVGVNFDDSKKIVYFLVNDLHLSKGEYVIVQTENVERFGKVVTDVISVREADFDTSFGKVVRLATNEDKRVNEVNCLDAEKALGDAKRLVSELGLDMQVLSARFSFDRKQLVFNFLADSRVDFRELAKKLAGIYKTRIELRQIGIRDKAKIIGGYGQCGRKLCCFSFLDDISSVSINMAKNQNLALNPQKINGACGRLMCCLAYENDCYKEYKKDLPKVGEKVVVNGENGKVVFVDIFSRKYKVELSNSKIVEVFLEE